MLSVLIPLCVLVTSAISGVLGMAGGMILMGTLVSLLPVATAIIIHASAQFVANISRASLHHRHISWRAFIHYAVGAMLGTAVMSVIVFVPSETTVFFLLGILPFLQLLLAGRIQLDIMRPWQGIACGFLSITLHLAGGVAGMLIDVFFQRTAMTRHQIVATKAATQSLAHTIRFAYFAILSGTVAGGIEQLGPVSMAAIVAAAIGGTVLAGRLLDRLSDQRFREITQWILLLLGAVYLARAALLWMAT